MNIISREQSEYHNHSTQQCPYNARVGPAQCGMCIRLVFYRLNFWKVWPGSPTDVLHIAVCSVLLSMNSS